MMTLMPATCFFSMFEFEMGGNNFLFIKRHEVVEDTGYFCASLPSQFEPMIMEITGFVHIFLIMVLEWVGDGKQTFGFIPKREPKVSIFRTETVHCGLFTTATYYRVTSSPKITNDI